MLCVDALRVVKPHECEPGTLLLAGAHFDEPPIFIFGVGEQKYWFELRGPNPFIVHAMAVNLNPYIAGGQPRLLVDMGSTVSPQRGDIPQGAAVLLGGEACFAVRLNYGTSYVRLDGQMAEDPRSYERLVSFTRWQLVVPGFGLDKWHVVHEAGHPEGAAFK